MVSAGIIPFRFNEELQKPQYFVGHPTGAGNYWAFLKGRHEKDEADYATTAIREFKEESGFGGSINPDDIIALGRVHQRSNKDVIAFAWNNPDMDPEQCHSNLIEDSDRPEIDVYRWMTIDELRTVTHPRHIVFYELMEQIITGENK